MANKHLPNRNLHPTIMRYGQTVLYLILTAALCGCAIEQHKASRYDQYDKFDGKFGHLFYKDTFWAQIQVMTN
jgi:hypothetical protein